MPYAPPRVCSWRGCSVVAVSGSLCPRHAAERAEQQRSTAAAFDKDRGSAASRGYGARWRALREAFLRKHPLCSHCKDPTPATDVDHIVPLARGGTNDWSNLQPLCHACHSRKTATSDSRFASGRRVGGLSSLGPFLPGP